MDLAGLINVEAEIARTLKECEKLQGLLAGKQKKLQSKNFVERAPAAVVQQERDSLAELQEVQTATTTAVSAMVDQLKRSQGGDGSAG